MPMVDLKPDVRAFLEQDKRLLIGEGWSAAQSDTVIDIVNPSDGQRIGAIAESSHADVDRAVAAARRAFDDGPWPEMKPAARARLLQRIADAMEAEAEGLAQLETLDTGKPISLSRGDVGAAIGAMRYYAGWADKITGSTHSISMPGDHHVYTLKEPVGVAALIVPWNYPIVMAAMKLGPCLAAGCTAVLKPAEDTSLTALRLGELALEAGIPEGVLNILTGYGRTVGAALVSHPAIDKVAFTGSTETGRTVAEAAAKGLKKVSLELGGKSPNIVMADADLEAAVMGSAMGIFWNSGQTCTAPSRLYVHETTKDALVAGIARVASSMKIAPGLDEEAQLGPLISQKQLDRVTGFIETGLAEGGELAAGGRRHGEAGFFLEPTIIVQTDNSMKVVREEIFGPVLVVQSFRDMGEAVRLANDSDYGLAASIWTRDISVGHRLARQVKAGVVAINAPMGADWDVPIGGSKSSGIGRENGREGLENYLQTKSVFTAL